MPIAVVTGAGQGIGLATARRLSDAGYRTVLVGRDRAKLDKAATEITGPTLCVEADLTVPEQVEELFTTVEETWGWAEVLVANAGTSLAAPITQTTDAQWQQMIDTNLTAPFRCIRRALPPMLEARRGRIVVIASVVAKRGERQVSAYTASKHGVLGLTKAAAVEVANDGVRVNAVCPAAIRTAMMDVLAPERQEELMAPQAMKRFGEPREVAEAVVWLCSDRASFVTGIGMPVDAGAMAY